MLTIILGGRLESLGDGIWWNVSRLTIESEVVAREVRKSVWASRAGPGGLGVVSGHLILPEFLNSAVCVSF